MSQDTFCPYPWSNLMVAMDGTCRVCCKTYHTVKDESGHPLKSQTTSLNEIWMAKDLQNFRRDLSSGVARSECQSCWKEERAGRKSHRQIAIESDWFPKVNPSEKVEPPTSLDLKLSNLCNLKCRICGPEYSSKWISDYENLRGKPDPYFRSFSKTSFLGTPERKQQLIEWLPRLRRLELFGGETLLNPEFYEILELCVDSGRASQISLFSNTNGTVFNDRLGPLLNKFEKVYLGLRLDDIGDRFEYQRKGAKWPQVQACLKGFESIASDRIQIKLAPTISVLNVFYLDEILTWMRTHTKLPIYLNVLHDPAQYAIANLPMAVKEEVISNLRKIPGEENRIAQFEIEALCQLMSQNRGSDRFFHDFQSMTLRLDQIRQEDFFKTFPRIVEGFERHGFALKASPALHENA
ncbi:MAG: twitch domain-containing radical SAM protein [Bdellovibrionales bacterium]